MKTIICVTGITVLCGVCLAVGWAIGLGTAAAMEEQNLELRIIDLFNDENHVIKKES